MSTFRPQFHRRLAEFFANDIYSKTSNYYYYLGRVQPWDVTYIRTVEKPNDSDYCKCVIRQKEPVHLTDGNYDAILESDPSYAYENDVDIRSNIVYMHKISANDVSLVVPKHVWKSGERYVQWDDRKDMTAANTPFYVVNSENMVYKCLNNNSKLVEGEVDIPESNVEPRGNGKDTDYVVSCDDGYVWKYMYTIPTVKKTRFMSADYMPVQRALNDSFYNGGSIEGVSVLESGSGYSTATAVELVVAPPKNGGRQAKVSPNIDKAGSIVSVNVDDRGEGYAQDEVPEVKVVFNSENSGARGKYGNKTAVFSANVYEGEIDSISVLDPGIGYSSENSTYLVVSGDGVGASVSPTLNPNGEIVGVVVNSGGSGYTYATVTVVSGSNANTSSGSGAKFLVDVGGANIETDQSDVEQYATIREGAVYAVPVTKGGTGYTSKATVRIHGDGEVEATAVPIIEDGEIVQIKVTNPGAGYTYAVVVIEDELRSGVNEDAEAYAILPPIGGHGFNAVDELYADTLGVYISVRNDESLTELGQDFRQFGLLRNPCTVMTKQKYTGTTGSVLFKAILSNTVGLEDDAYVLIGTGGNSDDSINKSVPHRVVKVNHDTNEVILQQMSSIYFDLTEYCQLRYYNETRGSTSVYPIESVTSAPSIDKYSGDLLTCSNNVPYIVEDNKTLGIRTFITL